MSEEIKKIICDCCETEFKIITDSLKEISVCPFCGDEDVSVLLESNRDLFNEEE